MASIKEALIKDETRRNTELKNAVAAYIRDESKEAAELAVRLLEESTSITQCYLEKTRSVKLDFETNILKVGFVNNGEGAGLSVTDNAGKSRMQYKVWTSTNSVARTEALYDLEDAREALRHLKKLVPLTLFSKKQGGLVSAALPNFTSPSPAAKTATASAAKQDGKIPDKAPFKIRPEENIRPAQPAAKAGTKINLVENSHVPAPTPQRSREPEQVPLDVGSETQQRQYVRPPQAPKSGLPTTPIAMRLLIITAVISIIAVSAFFHQHMQSITEKQSFTTKEMESLENQLSKDKEQLKDKILKNEEALYSQSKEAERIKIMIEENTRMLQASQLAQSNRIAELSKELEGTRLLRLEEKLTNDIELQQIKERTMRLEKDLVNLKDILRRIIIEDVSAPPAATPYTPPGGASR